MKQLALTIALFIWAALASAQQEFKIGIVASLSGGFAAAAKDTMDGWQAWEKARGLPGKKIVARDARRRDQSGERLERLSPHRERPRRCKLVYLFIPQQLGDGGEVARLRVQGADRRRRRRRRHRHAGRSVAIQGRAGGARLHDACFRNTRRRRATSASRRSTPTDAFGQAEISNLKELAPKHGLADRRRRNVRRRGHQLQRAADAHPRREARHHLQRRQWPRRDPDLARVPADGLQAAAGRDAGGGQQGVLRRDRLARRRPTG